MGRPGVDVSICTASDCTPPVAGPAQTDADGLVTLQIPMTNPADGFVGYVQATSPEIVPTLLYWGHPLSEARFDGSQQVWGDWSMQVLTPAEAQSYWSALNIPWDTTRGTLAVGVSDCRHYVAPEVDVTIDPNDLQIDVYRSTGPGSFITYA